MGINHSSSTLSERETNFIIQLQENWVIDKKGKDIMNDPTQSEHIVVIVRIR